MNEDQKIVNFLNYIYHYKNNHPNSNWEVFLNSPYKNLEKSNEDYFEALHFSKKSLTYIIPKLVRLFDYPYIDGFLLHFLKWDYCFSEEEIICIKKRVKQSKNNKIIHDIEKLIRLLIKLEE